MSELRKTFNIVNGVPTAVDVFFSIRSLSQKLEVVLQKIKASFAHTNKIIQHSKIIYNVEDIADLYAKLQKNELSFKQFGEKIHKYLQTVTTFELQNRLKKMILGQGTLDTLEMQGHSTDLFLEISVFGKNSCWLANYFYEAVLLGNNRCAGVFLGKLIAN